MQFIQSFFTAVITIFLTLYFSRKYGLSDKDRSIVEKQFQIYNALYLNISKDSLGKPINSNLAKSNIRKLITELSNSDSLYNYIEPMLYEQLMTLNALPITNTELGDVQSQISDDFENIKYKLGYPCKQKYESQLQRYIILIPTCGYLIYSILTTLNKQPITDENTYLFVQIILIIFYFIFFGCIWRVFKYLLYSKKIKFLFRMLKKK